MEELRFPIGRFEVKPSYTAEELARELDRIETTPLRLGEAVRGLSEEQLDTPYRPEGWTVRQVVHHLPDSHSQSYGRFKLALTEDEPTIRPYMEDRWARLADYDAPVEVSLDLLAALHRRWMILLRSITPDQLPRLYHHPEWEAPLSVAATIAVYGWHGDHHIAHITSLREREGW